MKPKQRSVPPPEAWKLKQSKYGDLITVTFGCCWWNKELLLKKTNYYALKPFLGAHVLLSTATPRDNTPHTDSTCSAVSLHFERKSISLRHSRSPNWNHDGCLNNVMWYKSGRCTWSLLCVLIGKDTLNKGQQLGKLTDPFCKKFWTLFKLYFPPVFNLESLFNSHTGTFMSQYAPLNCSKFETSCLPTDHKTIAWQRKMTDSEQ